MSAMKRLVQRAEEGDEDIRMALEVITAAEELLQLCQPAAVTRQYEGRRYAHDLAVNDLYRR